MSTTSAALWTPLCRRVSLRFAAAIRSAWQIELKMDAAVGACLSFHAREFHAREASVEITEIAIKLGYAGDGGTRIAFGFWPARALSTTWR